MRPHAPHMILLTLALSLVIGFASVGAASQTGGEPTRPDSIAEARAAHALERAADRLDLAMDLARKVKSRDAEPARIILEEARAQLKRAREDFDNKSYDTAARFADSSEKLSNRALELLGREAGGPDVVAAEIQRTDRLLERLRENAPKPSPPRARRAYEQLLETQQDAKNHFERGDYGRALDLTHEVRRRVARMAAHARPRLDPQNVHRAVRLTERLIQDARELARDRQSRELQRRVEDAAEIQARARDQLDRQNYGDAHRLTLEAREVLKPALDSDRPPRGEAEVRDALIVTDNEIRRIRDILEDAGDRGALDRLQRAMDEQDLAWREFNGRQPRAALNHTRVARKLAREALGSGD